MVASEGFHFLKLLVDYFLVKKMLRHFDMMEVAIEQKRQIGSFRFSYFSNKDK